MVEKGVEYRSHEEREPRGEGQAEDDRSGHSPEGDVEQQGDHAGDGRDGGHEHGPRAGHRGLDDRPLERGARTVLGIDLVDEHDDVLDDHAQQPQPSGNGEETEVKVREQHPDRDADERQGQHARIINGSR